MRVGIRCALMELEIIVRLHTCFGVESDRLERIEGIFPRVGNITEPLRRRSNQSSKEIPDPTELI